MSNQYTPVGIWGPFPMNQNPLPPPTNNSNNNNTKQSTLNNISSLTNQIKQTSSNLYDKFKEHIPYSFQNKNDNNNINTNKNTINNQTLNENKYDDENPYQIEANISTFQNRVVGVEDITLYKISITSTLSNKQWDVYHKTQDFIDLHLIFTKFYPNPPSNPLGTIKTKNLNKIYINTEEHKQFMTNLNFFLQNITNRSDLLSSKYVVSFLKLENHFSDASLYQPLLLYDLNNELRFPVTASYLFNETKLLFLGLSKEKGNTLNQVFSKVSVFFKPPSSMNEIKGMLHIYNYIKNHNNETMFIDLYSKELISEVSSINYCYEKNILCVGLENGNVHLLKIFINETSKQTRELVEEIGLIKAHTNPILCTVFNSEIGYVYSFAKNKNIVINEINYLSTIKTIPIATGNICKVTDDLSLSRIILCDDIGTVYILDLLSNPLEPKVVQMAHNVLLNVTCLKVFYDKNLLCLGNSNCKLVLYWINDIELIKEKDINLRTSNVSINDIEISNKGEIYVALSNGSIVVYLHNTDYVEYVIDAHLQSVSRIHWNEEKKTIISVSKDQSVKMVQIPMSWLPSFFRKNKIENSLYILRKELWGYYHKRGYKSYEYDYVDIIDVDEKRKYSEDLDGWAVENE